jgi:hypothetical protein
LLNDVLKTVFLLFRSFDYAGFDVAVNHEYQSASDEMIFGNVFFFEAIARAIPGVQVSDGEGLNFFVVKGDRYLGISLKSGLNVFLMQVRKRE